jgi:hypothetical protein
MVYLESSPPDHLSQHQLGSVIHLSRASSHSGPGEAFEDLCTRGFIQPQLGRTLLAISEVANFLPHAGDITLANPGIANQQNMLRRLRGQLDSELIRGGSFPTLDLCCAAAASIYLDVLFSDSSSSLTPLTSSAEKLRSSLLRSASEVDWPQLLELLLWILFASSFLDCDNGVNLWLRGRLRGSLIRLKFSHLRWEDIRIVLQKFLWVDQRHEEAAKHLFMDMMGRRSTT